MYSLSNYRGLALTLGLLFTALSRLSADQSPAAPGREVRSFDAQWRFLQADAAGAEKPRFEDSAWKILDLPHDWSIAGPIAQENATGKSGAYLPAGIGWYRKTFSLPPADANRRVFVEFDGVMANSDVWINGHLLGHRPNGYVSFHYELTDHLRYGSDETNVLAVRADNRDQPASRWYEGAGIYRHVRLVSCSPLHVGYHGVFASTPKLSPDSAIVRVQAEIENQSAIPEAASTIVSILDPQGSTVARAETPPQEVGPGTAKTIQVELAVKNPRRWDIAAPSLYRVVTEVRARGVTLDKTTTPFGIRDFHFEPATGFWINGRNIKIKGVCLHQDAGALGIAVPLSIWERRLTALKALGVNAVRTAHNPMAPEFIDLCDRLGLLVLDEMFDCWTVAKNPYDYHLAFEQWAVVDTRDTVRRDRNHPSVFAYSAGNEIHDTRDAALAKRILGQLLRAFHDEDPSRPVTQALFRPNISHDYDNGLADMLDVVGQNYREREILAAYQQKPTRKILGTENGHEREIWLMLRDNPPYSGQFLWPGIAYLGESPGWPAITRPIGLFDRTGEPYPRAFERKSWWSDEPMVYIVRRIGAEQSSEIDPGYGAERRRRQTVFADWTPKEGTPHPEIVEIYSNAETVELFLNGRSLGVKPLPANASPRTWKVTYVPGKLEAVARNGGAEVARHTLHTAGEPARLKVSIDRSGLSATWEEVALVRVEIVDTQGILVPTASNEVKFGVSGPGRIVAVDNADSSSHESFVGSERRAYEGRCIAILRATAAAGKITIQASAPGLEPASATLN